MAWLNWCNLIDVFHFPSHIQNKKVFQTMICYETGYNCNTINQSIIFGRHGDLFSIVMDLLTEICFCVIWHHVNVNFSMHAHIAIMRRMLFYPRCSNRCRKYIRAHSTDNILMAIQSRVKVGITIHQLLAFRSLQNSTHATTTQMLCHVQIFVAWKKQITISIELKIASEIKPGPKWCDLFSLAEIVPRLNVIITERD